MTKQRKFDIQERTFKFAVRVVKLVNRLPRTVAGIGVGRQVVRSATSVGANVEEADAAESKQDFIHKRRRGRHVTGCVLSKQPCSKMTKSGP